MEPLDGTSRQSGLLSIINREQVDRIITSKTYTSTMATSVVSPTSMSMFSNGPPPPYQGWSGPSARTSGLISPPESRRTSDNKSEPPLQIQTTAPHRQSLPSIHEALSSGGPKPNPYVSPVSTSLPPSHQIPYTQAQAPSIPRTYSSEHTAYQPQLVPSQPRRPSPPQPVQLHAHSYTRTESIPTTFPEGRHSSLTTSLQTAPGPPPNLYAGPRYEPSRYEQDSRAPERMSGYTHHPPQSQQPSYQYGPQLGHMPPTGPPGPAYSQPRYQPRDEREPVESWKIREGYKTEQPEFRHGLKRHLDVWDFENNLAQINTSSRVLMDWSHHYNAIAQEQQRGVNMIPDRMPTLDNCKEMIDHGEAIMLSLTRMKEMITQQEIHMMDQRMREHGGKGGEYDEEMTMYGDDMNKGFGNSEGKKQRRGRAAPPGRCHSCNRAETPEWRRGPDGARTLCNACGLHYAKLTRKQTMKQSQGSNGSSLRPKSMDDPSPRAI